MPGQIIFLHGPSSSGKTTLARALQNRIEAPFWHVSIDHLRDSDTLPLARVKAGDFQWKTMRAAVFDGFHASLAAYARTGNNLIVEHILDTPGWADDLHRLLAPFDVLFIGLHCPLTTLKQREKTRRDWPLGSPEQDFNTVHEARIYDLTLDSTQPATENAEKILTLWRSGKRQSEFAPNV
ncbi:chloramphenicol phosphotransferase CPT family protein [Pseudoprimorskyibacter insulae]|uniref:Chloramphenicol 3-O phosphotransferase n=1 Tax=Pseudoprimorskyibacter insulae TaxID=1695997 RepID=A0A2R8AXX1_9RHOB|nr:AAA family ATPase [Pseudoprimorskyibacter insulae]SPF80817.1 Chloramphenicol 3-O phosphotransferase [Pseudoprimorskyibacter insulae]